MTIFIEYCLKENKEVQVCEGKVRWGNRGSIPPVSSLDFQRSSKSLVSDFRTFAVIIKNS